MRTAYLDARHGVSGDMLLGALVDGGCPLERIEAALAGVVPVPFRLARRDVERAGTRCAKVDVAIEASGTPDGPTLTAVRDTVADGPLAAPLKVPSLKVLDRLAEAESRARGKPAGAIRLSEADAADLVIDVVGTVAGLDALGLAELRASPLCLGQGHPTALELARGWPVLADGPARELTTPTGAALVTSLALPVGHPAFVLDRAGYGAGSWDGGMERWPNYVGLWIGGPSPWERDTVWELSTNLDNFNPEGTGLLFDRLFAAGAVDAWTAPIQMKKSRPGILLTVLAADDAVERVERVLFAETPTLGVRRVLAQREKLPRRFETVETAYGPVRFKVGRVADGPGGEKASPEFEDLKVLAARHGLPLPQVREEAARAWLARRGERA